MESLVDEDGTFLNRANALGVTVAGVAPTIAITGNASVNEGSARDLGAVTDPGNGHGRQLHRPLGRRRHRHLHQQRRAKTHTYADGPSRSITVVPVVADGVL